MTDRTSAGAFAQVFTIINDTMPDSEVRTQTALTVWRLATGGAYDFSPSDMNIDVILVLLGLAEVVSDDGELHYLGDKP